MGLVLRPFKVVECNCSRYNWFLGKGICFLKTLKIADRTVPAVGVGTWYMGENQAIHQQEVKAIQAAVHAGARLIDTAEMYGSGQAETLVGEAIAPFKRQDLVIVDKVLPQNANKKAMAHSLEQSLRRLQTDYVDLYLYHWRGSTPLAETVSELQRLQKSGKILRWGVSNFDTDDMQELAKLANVQEIATDQVLYNVNQRGPEYDLIPWLAKQQIPMMAYSPVDHGGLKRSAQLQNPALLAMAQDHQANVMQVLLAWVIPRDNIIAIPKTSVPEHAQENIAAADIQLSPAELKTIDGIFPAPTRKEPLAIY